MNSIKRKFAYTAFSVGLATLILGCGGSGNNNSTSQTGTGNYIDSPVAGVSYVCGSQSGITDDNGTFKFENGKGCTFKLADIKLREVNSTELYNGKKIVEDNVTVAAFLQSLDYDGNVSNGITIKKEIVNFIKKEKINHIPQQHDVLDDLTDKIKDKYPTFKGKAKSSELVKEHLKHTKLSIIKELLDKKTFYLVDEDKTLTEPKEVTVKVESDTIKITPLCTAQLDSIKDYKDYIEFKNQDNKEYRLYKSEAKANAYLGIDNDEDSGGSGGSGGSGD